MRAPTGTRAPVWVWLTPLLVSLAITVPFIGRPVLWQDELATYSVTTRSYPDLLRSLVHQDGVLGLYYSVVHLWVLVAGASPTSLRLPSAVFVALAAALTALIGARLLDPVAGLVAGLLLPVLPMLTRYAQEARAEAMTVFFAALATALLLRALAATEHRPLAPGWWVLRGEPGWLAYAAAVLLLGYSQLTALGLLLAHGTGVLLLSRRSGAAGGQLWRWASACLPALVLVLPAVAVGRLQQSQVSWIPPNSLHTLATLPTTLFLDQVNGWTVLALALLVLLGTVLTHRYRAAAGFATALAVLPVLALLAVALASPLFRGRYLVFTLVGWCLLLAVPAAGRWWAGALVVAAVALSGVPGQVTARAPVRPGQPDYRAIAAVLVTHEQPGDVMVVPTAHGQRFRVGLTVYTPTRDLPRDVLAVATAVQTGRLDAKECTAASCLGHPLRVWVGCLGACTDPLQSLEPPVRHRLAAQGYLARQEWHEGGGAITLLTIR